MVTHEKCKNCKYGLFCIDGTRAVMHAKCKRCNVRGLYVVREYKATGLQKDSSVDTCVDTCVDTWGAFENIYAIGDLLSTDITNCAIRGSVDYIVCRDCLMASLMANRGEQHVP